MDEGQEGAIVGFVVGVVLTVLIWFFATDVVECAKVEKGYLTYQNQTYTVTLYDTLDKPEKENKD